MSETPSQTEVPDRDETADVRFQTVTTSPLDQATLNQGLGLIWFGGHPQALTAELPCLTVNLPVLAGGSDGLGELWLGAPSRQGRQDHIHYRADDHALFGVMQLEETTFPSRNRASPLQQASESAYARLFALLRDQGYPHLWRTWNYIPRINEHGAGLERYRQFNVGRQTAFAANDLPVETTAPAACALGTTAGPLSIGFIAGRVAPRLLENPRQVSAYHYPSHYGPRSPTFSRAALVSWRDPIEHRSLLFISGTASIVGHRSLHVGDVRAQTRETLANIEALLAEAVRHSPESGRFDPARMQYRVYLRHADDLAAVQAEIAANLGTGIGAVYLQADVCRQDLLVEIEATALAMH